MKKTGVVGGWVVFLSSSRIVELAPPPPPPPCRVEGAEVERAADVLQARASHDTGDERRVGVAEEYAGEYRVQHERLMEQALPSGLVPVGEEPRPGVPVRVQRNLTLGMRNRGL